MTTLLLCHIPCHLPASSVSIQCILVSYRLSEFPVLRREQGRTSPVWDTATWKQKYPQKLSLLFQFLPRIKEQIFYLSLSKILAQLQTHHICKKHIVFQSAMKFQQHHSLTMLGYN